jgi:alpha-N-arabinofuranosidase
MVLKFRFFILAIVFLASCFLFNCQKGLDAKAAEAVSNPISNPSFEIDASKKGPPISKYIYGQFIEHLGRCIYGGIWAEMLEDRKFCYPVTDDFNPWATATDPFWNAGPYKYLNASPWQVIGPAGTVTMDSTNPYVGAYTPVIRAPGSGAIAGIRQYGLAIVKGENYTGRIILAGDSETLPISVRLVSGNGEILSQEINRISPEFQVYPLTFTASSSSEAVKIEIISKGKGKFKIGTLSLMPADNIKGWRKDVVALLKELDSPIYRWPGGSFVSGYNWRDGIGERDKRPPRKNPAWKGVEHNDVGIHEYMELMELIGAEPFVSVNTGLGTVEEVAQEVQYCNASADTPMGKLRAQNGHPEPFNVKWWAVGNEMYGRWQLGHIPLEEYVKKHNRVAEAMWNVDKSIKLVGVGEVGKWSETMLKVCSDYMNLISEHIYCKEKTDVIEHTKQLSQQIIRKANAHRKYRKEIPELAGKDIRIAMDEWNFWYGDYIYGELGVRYHLKDALGVATGLHEYFRNSDLYFMANYAQTVNVIGCLKTSRTDAAFETTGLVLKLYRNNFGTLPVAVTGDTGPLDVAAAWTEDHKALTIAIVNPTEQEQKLTMNLKGAKLTSKGNLWLISHSDPMAYNEPGKEPNVMIVEKPVTGVSKKLSVPPLSISLYRLTTMK